MDLSPIHESLASKSYSEIPQICDELMLKLAALGVDFEQEWPYAVHLLAHIFVDDLNSARFLWKSIPAGVKESRPEVAAVWKIGQCLWTRDYAGVYVAVRGFDWSLKIAEFVNAFSENYAKRMFQLLLSAYATIAISDTAHLLGMSNEDAKNYALEQGWTLDPTSQMLTVKKQPVVTQQKVDPANLQRLTEYVFHLEH